MKKFLRVITYVIIFILIFFVCYILYSRFVLHKRELNVFGYSFYIVLTGSMEPNISPYDIVIVKDNNDIGKDDIIAFYDDNHVTVHRIVEEVTNDEGMVLYNTKGDNNNSIDQFLVSENNIIGKYVGKISKIGRVIYAILNNVILFILVILTLIFIFILIRVVRNRYREKKIEDKKE